jgi:Protein of unknown function (DUF1344)
MRIQKRNDEVESMGMFRTLIAILVTASPVFAVEATAQTQAPPPAGQRPPPPGAETPVQVGEKLIEGEVKSIDPSGTEITLKDGTRLVVPSGATIRPGVLTEGTPVVARYREQNGSKVLTALALKEPAASPPTAPREPSRTPPASPKY